MKISRILKSTLFKIILAALVLVALIYVVFKKPITDYTLDRLVKYGLSHHPLKLDDGLYAILAGTGSPMSDIERQGPCIAVVAGSKLYVVDAGNGAARNITLCGLNMGKIDALFLTHYHSDHIGGLGEMMLQRWATGSNHEPLPIYGPPGVEQVVAGFNMAYELDKGYRVAHHGAETMPPSGAGGVAKTFTLGDSDTASVVLINEYGIKITAFKVDHRPVVPAVGYKFEYKGRSLVISGDTKYCESMIVHSQGADVLFHEALNTQLVGLLNKYSNLGAGASAAKVTHDIPSYHTTPEQVAQIAQKAGVKSVVLYHIIPPISNWFLKSVFLGDAKKYYNGPITIGADGMLVSLPANSKEIDVRYLLK